MKQLQHTETGKRYYYSSKEAVFSETIFQNPFYSYTVRVLTFM